MFLDDLFILLLLSFLKVSPVYFLLLFLGLLGLLFVIFYLFGRLDEFTDIDRVGVNVFGMFELSFDSFVRTVESVWKRSLMLVDELFVSSVEGFSSHNFGFNPV